MEITFFLNPNDLKTLKEVFESKPDPGFTIVKEEHFEEYQIIWTTVYFKDAINLWYTIGAVFQQQDHERRIREMVSQALKPLNNGL